MDGGVSVTKKTPNRRTVSTWTVQVPLQSCHKSRNILDDWTRVDCPDERRKYQMQEQLNLVKKFSTNLTLNEGVSEENVQNSKKRKTINKFKVFNAN